LPGRREREHLGLETSKDRTPEGSGWLAAPDSSRRRGITARSILIGLVLAVAHTLWIIYEEMCFGRVAATNFTPVLSVVALLFLLLAVNSFLGRFAPSRTLAPSEVVVIFAMTTLSSVVAASGLTGQLFPMLLWPHYTAAGDPRYEPYLAQMPAHFIPQNKALIRELFLGSNHFWRFFHPEVLKAWAIPLAVWGGFLFLLVWTMLCLTCIFRRPWAEHEKLTFPTLELPLMMARQTTLGSLFNNPFFLVGFGMTSVVLSLNYLSGVFPNVPSLNLDALNLARYNVSPPYTGLNPIVITWWPYTLGLTYLIPLDILFSSWFFYVFFRAAMLLATVWGVRDPYAAYAPDQFPYFQTLSQGAIAGMFVVSIWSARRHLKEVLRSVFSLVFIPGEQAEAVRYRTATLGAFAGFAGLVALATASGMQFYTALLFFGIYLMAVTVLTRIYAQVCIPMFSTGLFYHSTDFVTNIMGTRALSRADATILTSFFWTDFGYRQHLMGREMESLIAAEKVGQSKRLMFRLIVASLMIGIVFGMLTLLQLFYDRGATSNRVHFSFYHIWFGSWAWGRMLQWREFPRSLDPFSILKIFFSAAVVMGLVYARSIWVGLPLNPIGYVLATAFAVEWIWNVIFVIWLIKWLVLRFGGLTLYRRSLPFFFGIALGDAISQITWGLLLGALGVKGVGPYGAARL